jgi:GPH family glycoside/pentoside/hexuronide:cation symporter
VRVLYSSASLSGNALSQAWALWLIYFYAPPADADIATRIPEIGGLDARVVLGAALTLARAIEAVDDPLIGYWTDRTRSRWGRRIPFVLFGTPWWCLLFVLLFLPPGEGSSAANLVYIFVLAQLFFLLSNVAGAAMEALLPHIARTSEDRVSVASLQVLFGVGGAAIGLSLSSLLVDLVGFAGMALAVAAIALAGRYVALAGSWRYAIADATPARAGVREAFTATFTNRHFIAYLPSFASFQVGLHLLTALLPFYVSAVLGESKLFGLTGAGNEGTFTFLLTLVVIGGMLAAVPLFARLARRSGKARAYRVAMLGAACYFPLLFFAGFLPGIPALAQALVAIGLAGVPTAGVFLFPNIITADIADDAARHTGTRREAMFYGSQNLVEKLATSLAPLLFALVLLAGDSAEDPLGVRLVGPLAAVLVLVGYLSFRTYNLVPLDELAAE